MLRRMVALGMFLLFVCSVSYAQEDDDCPHHRIGVGAHYWTALDEIDTKNIDESGMGWIISYQYVPVSIFKVEGSVEVVPNGYAGSDDWVVSPQVMAIVGSGLYGGVGIGIHYTDGEFGDNPYFAFRVGLDFPIMPYVYLDINANYRFDEWDTDEIKEDINTDTITIGAAVRIGF